MGKLLAPAKTIAEMQAIVTNDTVDAALCAVFIAVVLAMLVYGFLAIRRALSNPNVSAKEMGYEMQAAQ